MMSLCGGAFESIVTDANIVIVDFITCNVFDLEVTAGSEDYILTLVEVLGIVLIKNLAEAVFRITLVSSNRIKM